MKITKTHLKELIQQVLIEEDIASSPASQIVRLLKTHIGDTLILLPADVIKYGKILDDPKKTTSLSSARKQLIAKLVQSNNEMLNENEAFLIVRAIEGLSIFADMILPNKMKFEKFLEEYFKNVELPITLQTDAEVEAEENGEPVDTAK